MQKLNEYEAAIEFGFSPDLLRWLTDHPIIDKKVLPFEEKNSIYYFDIRDLKQIDAKMAGAWPLPKKGSRPTIPAGIKREIKEEALFSCPVCHTNLGEIAHITPVTDSFCNHPKNLLFLCPNHHTIYDFGYIYKNVSREDVLAYKSSLVRFKKHKWQIKGEIINTHLGALNASLYLLELPKEIKQYIDKEEFNTLFESTQKLVKNTKKKSAVPKTIADIKGKIEKEIKDAAENACPLCLGKGATQFFDVCPICFGNGTVDKDSDLSRLSQFQGVVCQLCSGEGTQNGLDCPACNGEGEIPSVYAETLDWSQFDMVECQLCEGTKKHDGEDCPACGGEGEMPRGYAEILDWSQFDIVECQLCAGTKKHEGEDCPACDGEGEMPRGYAERLDWSQYDLVECQLCEGTKKHDGEDCPACSGEGEMPRGYAEWLDWSQFDTVECQLCEGTKKHEGEDCPACDGEGEMPRGYAERLDCSQFDTVECQLCEGTKKHEGEDCPACDGEGEMPRGYAERLDWSRFDNH